MMLLDEVVALEESRLTALNRNDIDAVAKLMSADLVHVHATGAVQDRDHYLEGLRALPRMGRREDLQVRACGDQAAIITGHIVNTLTRPGQTSPEELRMMVTQVVRRESDHWRFVSFHACRAPQPEPGMPPDKR